MDSQADAQRSLEYWRLEGWREIGRELGRGSYAAVVEVDYKGLKCVGKKIHRVLYENGERDLVRRFEEECRLLSQLRHPHIVQFLGVYFEEHTNVPVLVMEFLPTTLAQTLDRYGRLPEEINYSILRDVSLGLRYLHERPNPIVHRDLSANNVLLSDNMTAKISDLGVARMLGLTPLQMKRMTQGPGTPCYMPPEALVPDPHYDVKIDIFSFGVLIAHVLSGEWPFPKEAVKVNPNDPSLLTPVSEMDRRSQCIEKIAGGHPLMQLIAQCLHNSPIERPQTADVCQQIDSITAQHPVAFENRVELLQQIQTALEEGASLRDEIQILHGERDDFLKQNQTTLEAQIEQHEATVTRLGEEFHSRMELVETSSKSEIERLQTDCDLRQCCNDAEMQQLRASLAELRDEITSLKEAQNAKDRAHTSQLEGERKDLEAQIAIIREQLQVEQKRYNADVNGLKFEMKASQEELEGQQRSHQAQIQAKEAEKAALLVELEESRSCVSRKEKTNDTLREQLGRLQEALLHSNQVHTPFSPGMQLIWSECANAPVGINRSLAVELIDESIFVEGMLTPFVFEYKVIKSKWTQLPPSPVKLFGLGQLRGKVVLVGGSTVSENHFSAKLHTLDDSQHWTESFPPMPTARRSSTVISYRRRSALVVCGGIGDGEKYLNTVELFEIETSQWCGLHSLPFPVAGMTVATMGDTCFLMGGLIGAKTATTAVFKCRIDHLIQQGSDPDIDTPWKVLPDSPNFLSTVAVLNGCIVSIGGWKSHAVADVYVYCPTVSKWVMVGELPAPRARCTAVVLPSNKLLVIGGYDGDDQSSKTAWQGKVDIA